MVHAGYAAVTQVLTHNRSGRKPTSHNTSNRVCRVEKANHVVIGLVEVGSPVVGDLESCSLPPQGRHI